MHNPARSTGDDARGYSSALLRSSPSFSSNKRQRPSPLLAHDSGSTFTYSHSPTHSPVPTPTRRAMGLASAPQSPDVESAAARHSFPRMYSPTSVAAFGLLLTAVYALALLVYVRQGGCGTTPASRDAEIATLQAQLQAAYATPAAIPPQPECPSCPKCVTATCPSCPACASCPECPGPTPVAVPPLVAAVSPPDFPKSQAVVRAVEVLDASPSAGDSSGTVFRINGRGNDSRLGDEYVVCSFTRVCAQSNRLLFTHSDPDRVKAFKTEWELCGKKGLPKAEIPAICSCFNVKFRPDFLTAEQRVVAAGGADAGGSSGGSGTSLYRPLHTWSVMKWVPIHHIAHWSQKLILWSSIFQHAHVLSLPPLEHLLFHDSDGPMTDHEEVILRAAVETIRPMEDGREHPISRPGGLGEGQITWAEALVKQQEAMESSYASQKSQGLPLATASEQLTCFDRLTLTPHFGIFSTDPVDTIPFRRTVHAHFSLPPMVPPDCPPRRVVLLYRTVLDFQTTNRWITNRDALRAAIREELEGLVEVEYVNIDENSSSRVQVELFGTAGLVLSSHSSQMVNMVFTPRGGAVIEVAAEFYNADFAEYAQGMGVFFQYALGGKVADGVEQPSQRECVQALAEACTAAGSGACILRNRWRCKNKGYPNKFNDFEADIAVVLQAVRNARHHLDWVCGGKWV